LSLLGPAPEVIPLEHEDRISTPSPPPSPSLCASSYLDALLPVPSTVRRSFGRRNHHANVFQRFHRSSSKRPPARVQSEISLSTISEEPNSYHSTPGNTPTPPTVCLPPAPYPGGGRSSAASHEIVVQPEFVVETTIT